MSDNAPDEYITVDEASMLLGVKKATLYAYVSRGLIHSYKQGIRRQRLYSRRQLEALLTIRPGVTPTETEATAETERLPPAAEWMARR
ncbi:MAG: helix-turn-helix domain-containing protein [Anaerolineae bacterium]|nr:helix-turn-helix domain-containing protein [Anaerolineae bacterium]